MEPKIRVVARRSSPCAARSACGVGADVVLLGGLVQAGDQPDGVVEQRDHVREGVAEEAADADGHVDARAAQLGQRDRLERR